MTINPLKRYESSILCEAKKMSFGCIAAFVCLILPQTVLADDPTTFSTRGHGHHFVSGYFEQNYGTPIYYVACNEAEGSTAFTWPAAGFGVDARARLHSGFCAQKRIYGYTRKEPVVGAVKFEGGGVAHPNAWFACDGNIAGIDSCQYFDPRTVHTLASNLTFFLSDPDEINIEIAQSDIILRADNRDQIAVNMDPSINATAMVAVLDNSSIGVEELWQRVEGSGTRAPFFQVGTLASFVESGIVPFGTLIEGLDPDAPAVLYEKVQEYPEYYIETLVLSNVDEVGDRVGLLVAFDDKMMLRHDLVNAIRPAQ